MAMLKKGVACVTGATGLVGGWMVRLLLKQGWHVRGVTRKANIPIQDVEVFSGDLKNIAFLQEVVEGADAIFHCAAELRDETLMHQTNVLGTKNLLTAMAGAEIRYFCHLSSVGVMGADLSGVVTEEMRCALVGAYEESKLEAERLVQDSGVCDKTVILRPTNVVDLLHPGVLGLSQGSLSDRIRILLKGAEHAHLVHAGDVAGAALYFLEKQVHGVQCYIVSIDEQPHTVGMACNALRKLSGKKSFPSIYLPWRIAYLIRTAFRGESVKGDIVFSSERIRKNGYKFTFDLNALLSDMAG